MSVSDLQASFSSLRSDIAHFLGYGRTISGLSASQVADIDSAMDKGILLFYNPPLVENPNKRGEMVKHDWSFLSPTTTIATAALEQQQDLPDDFSSIIGDFYYATNVTAHNVVKKPAAVLREAHQHNSATGKPYWFNIRPKSQNGITSQLFEVEWYPTPDAVYTLTYQYEVMPRTLSGHRPYPYGASVHSGTIREACLAAAELEKDGAYGAHYDVFLVSLRSSIHNDRKMFGTRNLGNEMGERFWNREFVRIDTVTVNGVQY